MQTRLLLATLTLAFALSACDLASTPTDTPSNQPSSSPVAAALGDPCLVGRWTQAKEIAITQTGNLSGYANAYMTITTSGLETTSYNASLPETGTMEGQSVSSTRRGTWEFQDTADGSNLVRTAISSNVTETFVINGATTVVHVTARPTTTFKYQCSQTQLYLYSASPTPSGSTATPASQFADLYTRAA
jgi:hypothetical protein